MLNLWLIATVVLVTVLSSFYTFLKRRYRYWEERGVAYLKPNLLFGNSKELFLYNVPDPVHVRNQYSKFPKHRFFGTFKLYDPELVIRDPELIKHILVKDFSHFHDRSTAALHKSDPLNYNLFSLAGQQWKSLKVKLSPTFTSTKMKMMFHLMKECADSLGPVMSADVNNGLNFEICDILARYTTDVISSCAFGLRVNSLENPDAEFRKMGKSIFENTLRFKVLTMIYGFWPRLPRLIGVNFTPKATEKYFINVVESSIKYRDENDVKRNDFLNLLMSLRNNAQRTNNYDDKNIGAVQPKTEQFEMTTLLIAAQCFAFFAAGSEVTSTVLGHCLVELAMQEDIQEKLWREINQIMEENGNELTYDALNAMRYANAVVFETLRRYTPLNALTRICTKTYRIPDTDIVLEKGTAVVIPIYGIHHDPQYYPNPDEFNPENFSEESKASRPSFTYLPFGEGPRICIGERFGMMQVKLGLVSLIRKYKFSLSPKMTLPIKLAPKNFILKIEGGVWLNFTERQFTQYDKEVTL